MIGQSAILDRQKQQLRLIWAAMLSAVVMYGAVCFLVLGASEAAADDTNEWLHTLVTSVAIIPGVLSIWWRRHFLSTDSGAAGVDVSMPFAQFQAHGLIVWALSEAVAVCGLVLAFVVHSFHEFIPFGVASVALLIMHHPFRLPYERVRAAVP
jgi:F0F1-type ATP synthase membrane subunit c/vacuolar-type H+-ATPase subunit K